METQTLVQKAFTPEVKLDGEGTVRSRIATLNVIDKDRDVTLPGFFGEQQASILIAHDWGQIPIGKGRVFEEGDAAVFEGKLNLKDGNARSAYDWLKFDLENGDPIQEWSYGFSLKEGGFKFGQHDGQDVRFLQPKDGGPGADIHEVSLVLVGAGEGTGTQQVKSWAPHDGAYFVSGGKWKPLAYEGDATPAGLKFNEQTTAALAVVDELVTRAKSLADLRAKEGRTLSTESMEKLRALADDLGELLDGDVSGEETPEFPYSEEQVDLLLEATTARLGGRV